MQSRLACNISNVRTPFVSAKFLKSLLSVSTFGKFMFLGIDASIIIDVLRNNFFQGAETSDANNRQLRSHRVSGAYRYIHVVATCSICWCVLGFGLVWLPSAEIY